LRDGYKMTRILLALGGASLILLGLISITGIAYPYNLYGILGFGLGINAIYMARQ
jgi:hypothetical protein